MNKNTFKNPIYRYLIIVICLLFSFNKTAFASIKKPLLSPNYALKNNLIKTDSINLDTLLIQFNTANNLKDSLEKAVAFKQLGSLAFEDYSTYSIRFFDSAQVYFKRLNKVKERALCLQSMAFVYEEKQENLDKGLEYAQSAIPLWQSINSETDEANMLKYIGFIYGKKEQYDTAFVHINRAIEKFGRLNNQRGVAVCYFDMASVFKQKMETDSCVHYLSKAKKIWISFETPSRIFKINNELLNIYIGYKATNNINTIIAENDALYLADLKNAIYWRDVDSFLIICIDYYDKNNDKARRDLFQMKKKKYLESIKNK